MRVTERTLTPATMAETVGYSRIVAGDEANLDETIVLKHDRLFLLVDEHGDIAPPGRRGLGLYFDDTRILSHLALRFNGSRGTLLSAQVVAQYMAQVDLALGERLYSEHAWDSRNHIHVRREMLLDDRLTERVTLTNHALHAVELTMELLVGCDFADIFEVRGWHRDERGQFFLPVTDDRTIAFRYRDRSDTLLHSSIHFADPPAELRADRAAWTVRLPPDARLDFEWEVLPEPVSPALAIGARTLDTRRAPLRAAYDAWHAECTGWQTDVEEFNHTLLHAIDDLRALHVEVDGESVISAGIPWYSTIFGRDSIIASLQTLSVNPAIAVQTLRYLAGRQGVVEDPFREEQPGRIMHELRRGELARAGETPHTPYFGTIDATPLWLILLHETWRWTGDDHLVRELLPHARRAIEWIDRYGDIDGDGFVEYHRTSEKGLVNQGWKDSGDGVPLPDGTLPDPPIALVEVQGYVHDAKLRMARLLHATGETREAAKLRDAAARLRRRIDEAFWMEDAGIYGIALDGHKRPVPVMTTNAGHLLWSRAVEPQRVEPLVDRLLAPDMFSGWGIRTLSERHAVFNPMSYHNGSVWPHDNALVVMGMAWYGHARRALPVLSAMHDAAANMRLHRLPELFCGMRRAYGLRPVLYPVSCSPQAWASGAFFMMLQAVLGIRPDAPRGVLRVREPVLPEFVERLELSGLRVGGARVSLEFRRHGRRTLANLLGTEGAPIRVVIELA